MNRMKLIGNMIKWIEKSGGSISRSIEIVEKNNQELSIYCKKKIEPLEVLIEIPEELCLQQTRILEDNNNNNNNEEEENEEEEENMMIKKKKKRNLQSYYKELLKEYKEQKNNFNNNNNDNDNDNFNENIEKYIDSNTFLELSLRELLLKEIKKGNQSNYHLYLQTLTSINNINKFPNYWNDNMWSNLKNTTLYQINKQRQKKENYFYESLFNNRELFQLYNENERKWSESIINSRSVLLENTLSLIPCIDLCNHDDNMVSNVIGTSGSVVIKSKYTTTHSSRINGYTLLALDDYQPGTEILRCYGNLSYEDKIIEYNWIDKERKIASYSTTKLGLPLKPQYHSYGKLKYSDSLCVFNGQNQYLYESICYYLQNNKISRGTFARALNRRLKQLQVDIDKNSEKIIEKIQKNKIENDKIIEQQQKQQELQNQRKNNNLSSLESNQKALMIQISNDNNDNINNNNSSNNNTTNNKEKEEEKEVTLDHLQNVDSILSFERGKIQILLALFDNEARYNQFIQKLDKIQKEREQKEDDQVEIIEQMIVTVYQETGLDLAQLFEGVEHDLSIYSKTQSQIENEVRDE